MDSDGSSQGNKEALKSEGIILASNIDDYSRESKNIKPGEDGWAQALYLDELIRVWGKNNKDWKTALKGKKVLDIAAGSAYSKDGTGHIWYPHFSRICAVNGADVTAIDINEQKGFDETLFKSIRGEIISMVTGEGLPQHPILQGQKFDIIYSNNFVGSNISPWLQDGLHNKGITYDDFFSKLKQQSESILAEGGVLRLGDREDTKWKYETKKDGKILPAVLKKSR